MKDVNKGETQTKKKRNIKKTLGIQVIQTSFRQRGKKKGREGGKVKRKKGGRQGGISYSITKLIMKKRRQKILKKQ